MGLIHRSAMALLVLVGLNGVVAAQPEKVEIAPGTSVTRKTYPVPLNEAPFFNFAEKTAAQKASDAEFVAGILKEIPDRAKAARNASERGWVFVGQGDFVTAAKRFNQALLLDPRDSATYHGFAAVVASRFKDYAFADELFVLAAGMNDPLNTLTGDRARVLMMAGRPADAKPLLEQAIREVPNWPVPKSNLAWALFQLGDRDGACRILGTIGSTDIRSVQADVAMLKQRASCP